MTLAKPERRNAFDAALIAELHEAFADVGDARVVVLSGDGPSFCAGADVEWQRASIDLSFDENVEDALRLYRDARGGRHVPGAGRRARPGLRARRRVRARRVRRRRRRGAGRDVFGFSEVRLGIIPAVISPFVLAKIGAGAARRYFLTGERFDAETALRIGLVHEIADDLGRAVERSSGEILTAGPRRRAPRSCSSASARPARTRAHRRGTRTSDEGQEGLRAFLEKRRRASFVEGPEG